MNINLKEMLNNGDIVTPCYVFDYSKLNEHIDKMYSIANNVIEYCYAMKANPFLINKIVGKIDKVEVCSPGELEICRTVGISGEHIIFSGVNKTFEDIATAVEYGVYIVTIESVRQFLYLKEYCIKNNCSVKVLLRLSSGMQFGMNKNDIEKIISNRSEYTFIDICGIHYFTGTQKKKIQDDYQEIDLICDYINEIREKYDFEIREFEYGAGLYVPYFEGENLEQGYEMLQSIVDYIKEKKLPYKCTLELGRFFVATSATYCTSIVDLKYSGESNICLVDGGIHQLNYYGQTMAMRVPYLQHIKIGTKTQDIMEQEDESTYEGNDWKVVGSLCTLADVLVRKLNLQNPHIGDVIAFENAGAYAVTEAPQLFLSRRFPNIYGYEDERGIEQLREEIQSYTFNYSRKV